VCAEIGLLDAAADAEEAEEEEEEEEDVVDDGAVALAAWNSPIITWYIAKT